MADLVGSGCIEFVVQTGEREPCRLKIELLAEDGQVRVRAIDTGMSNWQSLNATVPSAPFEAFVSRLRELLALPGGDCGTHGFWVESASIDVPLSSGDLKARAQGAEGFSSEPVAQLVLDFLDEAGRVPGATGFTWQTMKRRRQARRVVAVAVLMFAMLGAFIALRASSSVHTP